MEQTNHQYEDVEQYNIYADQESWLAALQSPMASKVDKQAAAYLKPAIKQYMIAPVGVYNRKPIQASSLKATNLEETRKYLGERHFILYTVEFIPSVPCYCNMVVDPVTHEYKTLDNPTISAATWLVRGAFVE